MLTAIIRYLKGYLKIRIIGYSPERFLNLCSHNGIFLWGLQPCEHAYELFISVKGFRKLKPVLKKTRTKVTIIKRYGLPFFLHKYRKRKIFFICALLSVILIYVLSLFIWNIHIEGNSSRTDETILKYLETVKVKHGMPKSEVDCERISKDIRKHYDDIIWVSASIKGTRLMIQVKENSDTIPVTEEKTKEAMDIVAAKNGTITDIVTRKGIPQVHIKDKVKKGDILVLGRVEVKNDAGEVIDYQYQESQGEILAKTTYNYENQISLTYYEKHYDGVEKVQNYLKVGSYVFSLGSLKNNYKHTEQHTKESQACIGEHFYLPLSFGRKVVKSYTPESKIYTEKEYQQLLSADFKRYCKELEKKGVQILENNVKIYKDKKAAIAKGKITVVESIGVPKPTKVITIEKKEEKEGNTDGNSGNSD